MTRTDIEIKRRAFLKKGLTGLAAAGAVPGVLKAAALGAKDTAGTLGAGKAAAKPIVRTLGKTGLKIPVVSMGVMNADNPSVVQAALESGIVLLDTAWGYQRGQNEKMIGQVIAGRPRGSFMIATKVPGPNRDRSMQGLDAAGIEQAFPGQVRRKPRTPRPRPRRDPLPPQQHRPGARPESGHHRGPPEGQEGGQGPLHRDHDPRQRAGGHPRDHRHEGL